MSQPWEQVVSSRYGAPMGRLSTTPLVGKIYLRHVPISPEGYDAGGAYWGVGARLWCAEGHEEGRMYFRAVDRDAAKTIIRVTHPEAKFYR
jgi:hypothetical protein